MILITVKSYIYTSIKDFIYHKIVYSQNGNNLIGTFVPSHNNANMSKEFVCPNSLIYLVKILVKSYILLIFVNCYQGFVMEDTFFFICVDIEVEPCNDTGYGIFGHACVVLVTLY